MRRFREITLLVENAGEPGRVDRVTFTPGALVGDVSATKRHAHAAISGLVGVECVDEHGEAHRLYPVATIATLARAARSNLSSFSPDNDETGKDSENE